MPRTRTGIVGVRGVRRVPFSIAVVPPMFAHAWRGTFLLFAPTVEGVLQQILHTDVYGRGTAASGSTVERERKGTVAGRKKRPGPAKNDSDVLLRHGTTGGGVEEW